MEIMHCPHCLEDNNKNASFCSSCGKKFGPLLYLPIGGYHIETSKDQLICPMCGTLFEIKMNFCNSCQVPLKIYLPPQAFLDMVVEWKGSLAEIMRKDPPNGFMIENLNPFCLTNWRPYDPYYGKREYTKKIVAMWRDFPYPFLLVKLARQLHELLMAGKIEEDTTENHPLPWFYSAPYLSLFVVKKYGVEVLGRRIPLNTTFSFDIKQNGEVTLIDTFSTYTDIPDKNA